MNAQGSERGRFAFFVSIALLLIVEMSAGILYWIADQPPRSMVGLTVMMVFCLGAFAAWCLFAAGMVKTATGRGPSDATVSILATINILLVLIALGGLAFSAMISARPEILAAGLLILITIGAVASITLLSADFVMEIDREQIGENKKKLTFLSVPLAQVLGSFQAYSAGCHDGEIIKRIDPMVTQLRKMETRFRGFSPTAVTDEDWGRLEPDLAQLSGMAVVGGEHLADFQNLETCQRLLTSLDQTLRNIELRARR